MQTARKGSLPVQCTREWVRGRLLQGDAAHGFSQCECFVTAPYMESEHGGRKSDKQKRHFMYWAIAHELGAHARGVAVQHTPCVQKEISRLYGASETGYIPSHERQKRKRKGGEEGGEKVEEGGAVGVE